MFSPAPFFEVIKKHRHNWATTPCQTLGINYTGAHPCPSEMCPPFPRAGSLTPTAAITTYILRCPNLFSSHPDLFPDLQISMTIHWTWPYARPQSPQTQHMQISQYPEQTPRPDVHSGSHWLPLLGSSHISSLFLISSGLHQPAVTQTTLRSQQSPDHDLCKRCLKLFLA